MKKKHWLVLERERHEAARKCAERVFKHDMKVIRQLSAQVGYLMNELEARDARIKVLEARND
jgi:hypothetical protein